MQEITFGKPRCSLPFIHSHAKYIKTGYAKINKPGEQQYIVRRLSAHDPLQADYQRLRADIFVHKFGWDIPVNDQGLEQDIYDQKPPDNMSVHCVFLDHSGSNYLVSGLRICALSNWQDSMIFNEFHAVGMIPPAILHYLQENYDVSTVLELTRLCVRQDPLTNGVRTINMDRGAIRDYTYAAIYALAEQTHHSFALAIMDRTYWTVLRRAHFVFKSIYTNFTGSKGGYALVMLDIKNTILALRAAGSIVRAERMLALCQADFTS